MLILDLWLFENNSLFRELCILTHVEIQTWNTKRCKQMKWGKKKKKRLLKSVPINTFPIAWNFIKICPYVLEHVLLIQHHIVLQKVCNQLPCLSLEHPTVKKKTMIFSFHCPLTPDTAYEGSVIFLPSSSIKVLPVAIC